MAVGAVVARILTQYSDKGSKAAQKDIAKLGKQIDAFGKKVAKSFTVAVTATAALAIKLGKDGVQAAIEDAKSQAVLAAAMTNTTGATKEAIASAEDYIKTTMLRVNVADEQLRASLATLYIATGDLTEAQRLQGIALDVAAVSGKDLSAVTSAITKAQQGNLTALKKLSPELSGLISTGMKAEEAFSLLEMTYAGSAEALANLDPLTKLKLAYGEVLETLGYALLPTIQKFVDLIVAEVLPVIEEWIAANGDKLAGALEGAAKFVMFLVDVLADLAAFYNKFDWIIKLAFSFLAVGRALKFFNKFAGPLGKILFNIKGSFKKLADGIIALGKPVKGNTLPLLAKYLGKLLKFVGGLTVAFSGLGASAIVAWNSLKSLFGGNEKLNASLDKTTKKIYGGAAAEKYKAEVAAAAAKKLAAARAKAAAEAAQEAAEAAKEAAAKALILKYEKELAKFGIKATSEKDPIQLAAAAKLLEKQGLVAKAEIEKLERLMEENLLLKARETLALRYADIQKALADQKLDTKEIEDLSKKWGISNTAVAAYIHLVKSVEDQVISTEEIKTLADMWNMSESEAHKFLETYMRIQDGLLDSREVFDLIQQGFFKSEKEARIYADLVAEIHDGIAKDEDFEKLALKWSLSREQVNDYIAAMGADFDYNGTFLDPITQLAIKWDGATAALNRYLAALNGIKTFDYNKLNPPGTPSVVTPKTPDPILGGSKTDSAASAAERAAASAQAAVEYALAKAKGDMDAARNAAAKVNPSALAAGESGAIGAASIAAQLAKAENDVRIAATYAQFKAKESADLLASQQLGAERDYDERFRFRSMTLANASSIAGNSGGNLMGGGSTNITVNVSGSVTSEQDLVQTIRNGLLSQQYNGDSITLQAV